MILELFKSKMLEYAKSGQTDKLDAVRFFLAEVKNKEIELRPQNKELTDEAVYKVLKKLIKQTDETIEMCLQAGRKDALEKAQVEKVILQEFVQFFPGEFLEMQTKIEQERLEKALAHKK